MDSKSLWKALILFSSKSIQQSHSLHKLVHAWGYERLGPVDQYEYSITGLQLLQNAISTYGKEPQGKLRLVPHVMANFGTVARASSGRENGIETTIEQVERMGGFVGGIGRFAEAHEVQKYAVKEWSKLRGQEHPSTISAKRWAYHYVYATTSHAFLPIKSWHVRRKGPRSVRHHLHEHLAASNSGDSGSTVISIIGCRGQPDRMVPFGRTHLRFFLPDIDALSAGIC